MKFYNQHPFVSELDGEPLRHKDRRGNERSLADGIRRCRRAGLFEQGRALYEKGGLNLDHLNDIEPIEVKDDYRICVRRGENGGGQA